jgi:hypothetical protein
MGQEIQDALASGWRGAWTTANSTPTLQAGFVSKLEAARLLRISSRTLNDCIRAKYIDVVRVHRRLLVSVQSVNRMLEPHPVSKASRDNLGASNRKSP